jgi:hypothetical protein
MNNARTTSSERELTRELRDAPLWLIDHRYIYTAAAARRSLGGHADADSTGLLGAWVLVNANAKALGPHGGS